MGTLTQARALLKDYLESFPSLAAVEILEGKPKDLGAAIDEAMSKMGLCAIIFPAKANTSRPDLPGPVIDDGEFLIRIYQNLTLDDVVVEAINVAEEIAGRCHLALLDESKQFKLRCTKNTIELGDDVGSEDQPCITWDVPIQFHVLLGATWQQVATPVITYDDSGRVQMTCATPGAQIFFTTDGKRPIPNQAGTAVYTGVLEEIENPAAIKAKAYLHGMLTSAMATAGPGEIEEVTVTLAQMNAALEAENSPFRWSSTGVPMIRGTDGKWSPIVVNVGPAPDLDRSLVTNNEATEEVP